MRLNLCPSFLALAVSSTCFGFQIISTAELQDAVRQRLAQLDNVQVTVDAAHYARVGTAEMHAEEPMPEDLVFDLRHTAVKSGDRYRLETHTVDSALQNQIGDLTIATWDLVEARTQIIKGQESNMPGVQEVQITTDFTSRPMWAHFSEPYLSLMGWCVMQDSQCRSFADWVGFENVIGPEMMEDGRTRWICPVPQSNGRSQIVIIAARVDGNVQVVEANRLVRQADDRGKPGEILAQHTIEFGALRDFGGALLPERATSFMQLFHSKVSDDTEDSWGYDEVVVVTAAPCQVTDEIFRIAITDHQTVIDKRYRITYTHGETHFNLDGRSVSTKEPLRGDVGACLEKWITPENRTRENSISKVDTAGSHETIASDPAR